VAAPAGNAGWRSYRTRFTPWRKVAAEGGTLHFGEITGAAEVWLDGKLVARKAGAAPGDLTAAIPAGNGARTLVVLIQAADGSSSGLTGRVYVSA
jgi:beta-galactosidase